MKTFLFSFSLLLATAAAMAQGEGSADYSASMGLKDAYKDYFTIGVAV